MKEYIKGKGILVGVFDEDDLKQNKDKLLVKNAQLETGYKYTNTEFVKKNGEIAALKIYVCSPEDIHI